MKEKYFETKYRTVGTLCKLNVVMQFKLRLQIEFRNNKNSSSLIVNFPYKFRPNNALT